MSDRSYSSGLMLGLVLVIAFLGLSVVATGNVAAQQVDVAASDLDGVGTQDDPYVITNASELQAMEDDLDGHYELSGDIDATETATWNGGNGFDPIGNNSFQFNGTLNGSDHTIDELSIARDNKNYTGMFGEVGQDGNINNLRLGAADISGRSNTATLVGVNRGNVTNVTATGSVNATGINVGGLIGYANTGFISGSSTTVTISSNESRAGGLVGAVGGDTSIVGSSASGNVNATESVGGLVGKVESPQGAKIAGSSYATGDVNGTRKVGGLIGFHNGSDSTVENLFAAGNVSGKENIGGLIGQHRGGDIIQSNASGNVYITSSEGYFFGGLIGRVGYNAHVNISQASATGNVTGGSIVGGLIGGYYR